MTRALPSRALLRKLHLWMALAIGLPVAFVSALGLPVTYWGESDALFDATFYGVGRTHAASQVDLDRLGAAALAVSHAVQLKGISLERDESDRIAADLGDRQVMILRNHGLLVCGRTVAEAFALLFSLERCCQIQIAAQSGGARLIQPPAAVVERTAQQYTRRLRQNDASNDGGHAIQWAAMRRWMQQESPGFDR